MFWFARLYQSRIAWAAGFIAMGIALEFAQGALGYRTSEVLDMVANTIGVFIGWITACALNGFSARR